MKGGEKMKKELITFEEVDSKELNGWGEVALSFGAGVAIGGLIVLT